MTNHYNGPGFSQVFQQPLIFVGCFPTSFFGKYTCLLSAWVFFFVVRRVFWVFWVARRQKPSMSINWSSWWPESSTSPMKNEFYNQVEINVFECNKFWKEICGKGQLPVHYPTRRNLNTVSNTTFFLRALAERIRILRLGIIFHWLNGHDMLSSMGREELTWWNRSIRIRSRQNKGPKVFGVLFMGRICI